VLVAQDIAVVPMLVFAQSGIDVLQQWPLLLVRVVIALVILVALLVWIGKTARQRLPMATLLEGNVELAILFSLGICFLAASLTGYIGLSPVFGAFCAGLALAHTNLRKAVLDAIQPVQSLLLVVFFVSIGLLVDLEYVKSHWGDDCWCDLWCSVYQNPSWMGAFNHWRRARRDGRLCHRLLPHKSANSALF
jgi:CPA2 family monovalent cation:H+ antiporter-2